MGAGLKRTADLFQLIELSVGSFANFVSTLPPIESMLLHTSFEQPTGTDASFFSFWSSW